MSIVPPVSWLAALIVEGCVGDEGGHIDVPHPVQEQAEILRCEAVKAAGRQHVEQACGARANRVGCQLPGQVLRPSVKM